MDNVYKFIIVEIVFTYNYYFGLFPMSDLF